jgi:hypothetical protein
MRFGLVAGLALVACLATGQQNPLQPEGFKPPQGPTYDLGPPNPALKEDRIVRWRSFGKIRGEGSRVWASEGVEFEYRGYTVRAEEAEGDTDTEQFTLRGNVTVRGANQVTVGEEIWIDFRERKYRFLRGRSDFSPRFFEGALLSDLFATAEASEGSEEHATLHAGGVTTCPLEHPHYGLYADAIDIDPYERIIFRDVRLRALGKTLIGLPHFILPLGRADYDGYLPDVGRSQLEGVYVKSKFDVALFGGRSTTARADFMERRGFGTGLEHAWTDGGFTFYSLYDQERRQNSLTGEFHHDQRFGNFALTTRADYRANNYLSFGESRALNARAGLAYRDRRNNLRLDFQESRNVNGQYGNENRTIGLTDTRDLGRGFSWTGRINYRSALTESGGKLLSEREDADVNLGLRYRSTLFDGELSYRRLVPIGDTTNFRPASEQTPVLTLRSDSWRLFRLGALPKVGIEGEFGQYLDTFTDRRITREALRLQTTRRSGVGRGWSLGYQSEFRQSFYSDDTAQYVLNEGLEARYGLSDEERSQALVLRYRYTRPYGFTPLALDRRGQVNVLSTLWEVPLGSQLTARVGGGYDFLREQRGTQAWNTVGVALRYRPADYFGAVLTSSYDPTSALWSSTRIRVNWDAGATKIRTEARYDGRRQVWGNLNFRLEGFKWGRLKTSLLLLYNGYLKQFETRQVHLIYDLHCVEAILAYRDTPIGFRSGRDIQFMIRIKALPFSSDFGLGPSGQALDTSTGVDF